MSTEGGEKENPEGIDWDALVVEAEKRLGYQPEPDTLMWCDGLEGIDTDLDQRAAENIQHADTLFDDRLKAEVERIRARAEALKIMEQRRQQMIATELGDNSFMMITLEDGSTDYFDLVKKEEWESFISRFERYFFQGDDDSVTKILSALTEDPDEMPEIYSHLAFAVYRVKHRKAYEEHYFENHPDKRIIFEIDQLIRNLAPIEAVVRGTTNDLKP